MPPRRQHRQRDEPDSIRTVQQCIGHTKTGARCKRRTSKTPYCFTHLEKEQHLKIKPSQIPGIGLGLYTTVRRPAGRLVAPYTGRQIERPNDRYRGAYVIQLNHPPQAPPYKFVDANHTTDGAGRYANAARRRNHFTNNSRLRSDPQHAFQAKVISIRPIPAGKEIFASYGRDYVFPREANN